MNFKAIITLIAKLKPVNKEKLRREKLAKLFQLGNEVRCLRNGRIYKIFDVTLGTALMIDAADNVIMASWYSSAGRLRTEVLDLGVLEMRVHQGSGPVGDGREQRLVLEDTDVEQPIPHVGERRDAETAGGILAIDDDEIELEVRNQPRKLLPHRRAAGASDHVTQEKKSHAASRVPNARETVSGYLAMTFR